MTKTSSKEDLYTRVTNRILADLEQGVRPWFKPWQAGHTEGRITRPLRHNGQPYSGINVLLLWGEALARGYGSPTWMTFRQALSLGGAVRKGETGSLVVYAGSVQKSETDEAGNETEKDIRFLKGYTVFNVAQIDGLPEAYHAPVTPLAPSADRIAHADAFFAATGATIRHGGNRAYYSGQSDHVQIPPFEAFQDPESYYATLGHECIHWTKHESRLDRDFGRQRWGDEGYAREELVAELGSAFLAADLGLSLEPRPDHASYIASWLKVLKDDKRFVFSAASQAQKATDFLHRLQPAAAVVRSAPGDRHVA